MKTQVQDTHYCFSQYVDWRRWQSYYFQLKESIESDCDSFLLIGIGDGLIPNVLQKAGKIVDTFDYDEKLNPTYCGDIRNIDRVVKKKYDCIICCEVLEHIEYSCFERVVCQLAQICMKRCIISIPAKRIELAIYFDFSLLNQIKKIRFIIPKFWIKEHKFDGEHYWEVGTKKNPKKEIERYVLKYFKRIKSFHCPGNSYHWFIIAEVNP